MPVPPNYGKRCRERDMTKDQTTRDSEAKNFRPAVAEASNRYLAAAVP